MKIKQRNFGYSSVFVRRDRAENLTNFQDWGMIDGEKERTSAYTDRRKGHAAMMTKTMVSSTAMLSFFDPGQVGGSVSVRFF